MYKWTRGFILYTNVILYRDNKPFDNKYGISKKEDKKWNRIWMQSGYVFVLV